MRFLPEITGSFPLVFRVKHGFRAADRDARSQPDVPKSQTGFIGFFVMPLYKTLAEELPAASVCVAQLEKVGCRLSFKYI